MKDGRRGGGDPFLKEASHPLIHLQRRPFLRVHAQLPARRWPRVVADVWFIAALISPLFGAMALGHLYAHKIGAPLIALLAGAPALLQDLPSSLFFKACLLPCLWWSIEALLLRVVLDMRLERPWVGSLLMMARWAALVVMGGATTHVIASCVAMSSIYLGLALFAMRWTQGRAWVFELCVGGAVAERVIAAILLPSIA